MTPRLDLYRYNWVKQEEILDNVLRESKSTASGARAWQEGSSNSLNEPVVNAGPDKILQIEG